MDNLSVGQKAVRSITLTAEHVGSYAEITGDHNPLHQCPSRSTCGSFWQNFSQKTSFNNDSDKKSEGPQAGLFSMCKH